MHDYGRYAERVGSLPDALRLEVDRRLIAAHALLADVKAYELQEAQLQVRRDTLARSSHRSALVLLPVGGVVLTLGGLLDVVARWSHAEGFSNMWLAGLVIMFTGGALILYADRLRNG